MLPHSKAIFSQLADTPGTAGVHTVIENHDAWLHNAAVMMQVSAAMRAQIAASPRPVDTAQRIAEQQSRLQSLLTRLPLRLSTAG